MSFPGHIPILQDVSDDVCLVWNCEEIVELLAKHPCVQLYVAGHTHCSAYACDASGIHHLNLPGIVEISTDLNGFGTLAVFGDRFELTGYGGYLESRIMPFRKMNTSMNGSI